MLASLPPAIWHRGFDANISRTLSAPCFRWLEGPAARVLRRLVDRALEGAPADRELTMSPERKEPCEGKEREGGRAAAPLRAGSLEQPRRFEGKSGAERSAGNETGKMS
jgi:hypothetical protein